MGELVRRARVLVSRTRALLELPFQVDPVRTTASLVLMIFSQLTGIGSAVALGVITNAVIRGSGPDAIWGVALLVLTVVLTQATNWGSFVLRAALIERTSFMTDQELARLLVVPVGIEHLERPEYLDRVDYLRQNKSKLTSVPLHAALVLSVVLRVAATFVVLVTLQPVLLVLVPFAVPLIVLSMVRNRRVAASWARVAPLWREQGTIRRFAGTSAGGQEIRVFGLQTELRRRHWELMEGADRDLRHTSLSWSALVAGAWVIFGAALTAALVVMGHEATKGAVSAGALVVVITLAMQLSTSMGTLAFSMSEVGGAMQAVDRLQWLRRYSSVDHEGLRDGSQDGPAPVTRQALPEAISDGIRLDGVCFRYSDKGPNVLSDVDLLLPAGATIAIVGENGAGKSTLVKLLLRLYPPSAGRIFIDGVDLEATDPAEWRSRTSAGFQDFARFEFTLQQAVAIGSLEQLDDPPAARHALTQAGGQDLLQVLDDGLSTQLGRKMDDGVELSGGQWQKVALGRSMMRQTPLLLVLDEPTAALDALSEAALFDRYALAARSASRGSGAVTVLVSHRYSTVRSADLIVVLQHGKVCEMGTHHQLMKANKVYAELYRTQAAAYR